MSLLAQDERLTRRVGAITLLVLAAAILFMVFLVDRIELGRHTRIRVYFRHSAGLRVGAPLVVGGQPIGRIEALVPVARGAPSPLGGEGGTAALVAIDGAHAWKVPADADVFVASRGVLSERYLEVAPPRGEPAPPVRPGAELRASDPPSLDTVLTRTWANMTVLREFIAEIGPELDALRAELATLARALADDPAAGAARDAALLARITPLLAEGRAVVAEADRAYERGLGGEPGADRAARLLEDTRATLTDVRAILDRLAPVASALRARALAVRGQLAADDPVARLDDLIARSRATLARAEPLLAQLTDLRDRIARGEGSLGRIMTDPEFPEDAKEIGKVLKRTPWRVIARPQD